MRHRTRALLTGVLICWSVSGQEKPYFPAKTWREAAPESQGIDSAALGQVIDRVRENQIGLHSLLVIRHGYAVLDAYFYPFQPGIPHDAASVTKSITSILTGIAADKGLLKTDQRVLPLFPKERPANADERKLRMTIEDLLTMQPGLDCGFLPGEQELAAMRQSPNWVRTALSLPMRNNPGTVYGYCSPGFHLLSSIITAASGQSEADFARKNLFEPLGIHGVIWPADPQGRTHGWGNSHLLPSDFAKLGYLYLHDGEWDGKQVVSSDWVRRSVSPHARMRPKVEYGYGWWLYNEQTPVTFEANGRGGQRIIVAPKLDMVVVMTGGGYDPGPIARAVFDAVKTDRPLPANAAAQKELRAQSDRARRPPPPGFLNPILPSAASISGKVYNLEPNGTRIESLSLTFKQPVEATLQFRMQDRDMTIPVGLSGAYLISADGPYGLPIGAMGKWTSANEFLLDLNLVANINHYVLNLRFSEDQVEILANETSGLAKNLRVTGKAQ